MSFARRHHLRLTPPTNVVGDRTCSRHRRTALPRATRGCHVLRTDWSHWAWLAFSRRCVVGMVSKFFTNRMLSSELICMKITLFRRTRQTTTNGVKNNVRWVKQRCFSRRPLFTSVINESHSRRRRRSLTTTLFVCNQADGN